MLLLALYIALATISVVAHGLELHMLRATDTQPYGVANKKDENCDVAHIMLLILSRVNSKHFTVTQGKTAVGDRGMTKIILTLCNELAVLLPLK